ncbi:uncharacterized protein LOC116604715 [Nematostella vectensis]|uniref:uncharacterized protein LOC116604715 n=1 Tax=Nematostella vectensis TaxID=45351 RepID=UPI00207711BB|nr:uncharacterized protein LOC116604715 [Nematostella vectensis]
MAVFPLVHYRGFALLAALLHLCTAFPRRPAITCSPSTFNCTSNPARPNAFPPCIPASERCDCMINCEDGSDEKDCGHVHVDVNADNDHVIGTLTSFWYPRATNLTMLCTYNISTNHIGKYIKLVFGDFDLPVPKDVTCVDNYIMFENVEYIGSTGLLPVIDNGRTIGGGFCGSTKPPILKSQLPGPRGPQGPQNSETHPATWLTMTVKINSNSKEGRGFMVTWYSVVQSFPPNLVPNKKETWPEFVTARVQHVKVQAKTDSTFIVSVVILSVMASGIVIFAIYRCYVAKKNAGWNVSATGGEQHSSRSSNDDMTISVSNNRASGSSQQQLARRRNGNEMTPINRAVTGSQQYT